MGLYLGYLKDFENVERLDILPYHTMGVVKYQALGDEYPLKDVPALTKEDAHRALEIINSTNDKELANEKC